MTELVYQRQFRTSSSESYLIQREGRPFGHLDLHFGASEVSGTLILLQDQADAELLKVVDQIDEDLVVSADTPREDLLLTVFKGQEVAFYTDELQRGEAATEES